MGKGPKRRRKQGEGAVSEQMRGERLQVMLTPDELSALDDWRFTQRMPSRAAAIRELLRLGLAKEGYEQILGRAMSKDFGVT